MNEVSTRTGKIFNGTILPGIFATLIALVLYGYLGTFSRYGSDDYCLSAYYLSDLGFSPRLIDRYLYHSSRYTNILFIGLVDSLFGWYNVAILPPVMIGLFLLGWYLLVREVARVTSLGWSRAFCFFLTSLLLFFSLLQAPNLYETLYWRAGMTSHFAPLAFMPFLFVFIVQQISKAGDSTSSWWSRGAAFVFAFVLGGFSEPPVALIVTILTLALIAVWSRRDFRGRRAALHIVAWALLGAMLALVTLALAPANSIRLGSSVPGLYNLVTKTMRYPFEFIRDDLLAYPIPTLVSIFLPALLFFVEYSKQSKLSSNLKSSQFILGMILGTALAYLLIAASFAPSVYGQNFPIARARFAGRVILTGNLIIIGAMLGILIARSRIRLLLPSNLRLAALAALFLLSLYPLWTSRRVMEQIPAFQQRAQVWDERDALIRAMKAEATQNENCTSDGSLSTSRFMASRSI